MNKLNFATLRDANTRRLPLFKNAKGGIAHSIGDGSDWTLSAWVNASVGEFGELSEVILMAAMLKSIGKIGNMAKKIDRGDYTLNDIKQEIANELADCQAYLDLVAYRCDIDLGEATVAKWNAISRRVGVDIRIKEDGSGVMVVADGQ